MSVEKQTLADGVSLSFSEDEINAIYEELVALAVPLDIDPIAYGPKRLNGKTAEVRKMLDRVHRIYLEVSQKHGAIKRRLRRANADLVLAKNDLFANDPETRAGRNVADREAIAVMKLQAEVAALNNLEILDADLSAMLTVIKAKHADLRDTESHLRDQIRLCGEELSLGSRWGSAVPNAPEIDHRVATGADIKEIDRLLSGLDSQIDLAQKTGGFPESEQALGKWNPLPEAAHDVDVENLLEGFKQTDLSETHPATTDQNLVESFLDGLAPGIVKPKPKKEGPDTLPEVTDSIIEDLLASFEDMEG